MSSTFLAFSPGVQRVFSLAVASIFIAMVILLLFGACCLCFGGLGLPTRAELIDEDTKLVPSALVTVSQRPVRHFVPVERGAVTTPSKPTPYKRPMLTDLGKPPELPRPVPTLAHPPEPEDDDLDDFVDLDDYEGEYTNLEDDEDMMTTAR